MNKSKTKNQKRWLFLCCLSSVMILTSLIDGHSQMSMLSQSGTKIVNASGSEVIMKGINLGDWVLQEGWMISGDGNNPGTQSDMKRIYKNQGQTEAQIEAFYSSWRTNFIQKADIDFIKSKGMTCVRFPMHYELFLTAAQRAYRNAVVWDNSKYSAYKTQLANWVANNTLATDYTADGYKLIDNLITWCSANNIYIILDMHAAPGGQGTDTHISDCVSVANDLWLSTVNQDVLNAIWKNISTRYKTNSTIAMYDLINEPNNIPSTTTMKNVYQRLITTIRNNSDNHLLMIEGNAWGNNYTNITPTAFSPRTNLVYNIHRYGTSTSTTTTMSDANQLQELGNATAFRNTYQVPIFCGETGLNDNGWLSANINAMNSVGIGWTLWSYKWHTDWNSWGFGRIPGNYPADGAPVMASVLESIKFANLVQNTNTDYWAALSQGGSTTPPPPPPPPTCTVTNVPGTQQAESYCQMNGIQTETTTDTGGGQNVGWVDANDWMSYSINVPAAGTYTVQYRVASQSGGGSIRLESTGGTTVYGSIAVPSTGAWQTWTTISHNVTLPAGQQNISVVALAGGFNLNWLSFTAASTPPPPSFSTTIQAESYTQMSGVATETTTDTGGGQDVGWIDANDWMVYTAINIPTAGTYTIQYRVASLNGGGNIQIETAGGTPVFGSLAVPSTGGWQTWTTISHNVTLPAGSLSFGIKANAGGFNLNWFTVKSPGAREAVDDGEESLSGNVFSVYPTIVSDQLYIVNKLSSEAKVCIVDMAGRIILQQSIGKGSHTLDVSSLHEGLHVVKVSNGKDNQVVKILK
jgi:endoglucanase